MPRGGPRKAAPGKKMGRPKSTRPVDGNVARKIKARVKAEELWVFLIGKAAQKAKDTGNTSDLRQALTYLDDRDLGPIWNRPDEDGIQLAPTVRVTIEHIGTRAAHPAPAKAK